MHKKGLLLINLGTPNQDTPLAVFRYLQEFLNDPRVIDIPRLLRWILVNLLIIPGRYRKTTRAYQKIWTAEGSPLLVNSLRFTEALASELGEGFQVECGMRYGSPSIQEALEKLGNCNSLMVLPLFPQYSAAATGSAIARVLHLVAKQWNIPQLFIRKDFYDHPGFIAATAEIIKESLADRKIDQIIFSYHALPQRHLRKSQCQAPCNLIDPCPTIASNNQNCYRAQCFVSSRLIAQALELETSQYTVSFQSRLGRIPWIQPYTDLMLPKLIQQGIKNIAIACPSFVADCLETLEEVNLRFREAWHALGGGEFIFIPCVNTHVLWISTLAQSIKLECVARAG